MDTDADFKSLFLQGFHTSAFTLVKFDGNAEIGVADIFVYLNSTISTA